MIKFIISILLVVISSSIAFADTVDIYCPKCHKFLWELNYDIPLTLDDFKTNNIIKGEPSTKPLCPFDGAPINGWEYWAYERGMHPPVMAYPALTVWTLNEQGDFIWFPDDVVILDN